MGNLNQPIKKLLFNSLTDADVGVFVDSKENKMYLDFKKHGYRIAGAAPASAGLIDTTASGTKATTLTKLVKEKPEPGYLSGTMVTLSNAAPAVLANYAYGFDVIKEVWLPGVDNSQPEWRFRTYSGSLPIATLSAGVIQDADLLTMENDILDQITGDIKTDATALTFLQKDNEAIVEARRAYYITNSNTTDASGFTVTWPDGTTTVFVTAATFTAGQMAIQFNAKTTAAYGGAAFNALLICYRTGANTYIVTSRTAGLKFTLGTIVNGTGTTTFDTRRIYLKGRNVNCKVRVRITPDRGSIEKVTFVTLKSTTTAGTSILKVNGTATAAANDNATFATTAGNLNTALSNASITTMYATYDSTHIYLWGGPTVDTFYYVPSAASTTVLDGYGVVGRGSYPKMQWYDVFQTFAYAKNQGALANLEYNVQATKDATYYKYMIHAMNVTFSNSGTASGYENMKQRLEVYVLASAAIGSIYYGSDTQATWAWTNTTPASNNKSFEDLLGCWSGLAIASWV